MLRRQGRFFAWLCLALPWALLLPWVLRLEALQLDLCACGMRTGSCFCPLLSRGKASHCDLEGARKLCSLRSKAPLGSPNAPHPLELKDRIARLTSSADLLAPAWAGWTMPSTTPFRAQPLAPPDPPPPRPLLSVA